MGYTTRFDGNFTLTPAVSQEAFYDFAQMIRKDEYPFPRPHFECQWVIGDNGTSLAWDQVEKFYDWKEWLECLVTHFFVPRGIAVSGSVRWQGEEMPDRGVLAVVDGKVVATKGDGIIVAPTPDARFAYLVEAVRTVILPAVEDERLRGLSSEIKAILAKVGA